MIATEFKTEIKKLQNSLRGITLQLINSGSVKPYFTLKSFGNAILSEEEKGNSFSISQAWTNEGIVSIKSINHLSHLLSTTKVTGIQFKSYFEISEFSDFLKYSFGTTE